MSAPPVVQQQYRNPLNEWIPEKTRTVLYTAIDLVDWTTDALLLSALLGLSESIPSFKASIIARLAAQYIYTRRH